MKSTLTLAALTGLAGFLATGVTAQEEDPYYFVAFIQQDNYTQHDYMFSPGVQDNGDTLIHLGHGGSFFYVDDSTSQLVMTAADQDIIIGNAWIDTNDKGILKFSNDPDAHDYALFARNDYNQTTNTLLPQGVNDWWFWCPLDGADVNGTVAIGQVAGEGCEQLSGILIAYGD